jgi:hypothetical protein
MTSNLETIGFKMETFDKVDAKIDAKNNLPDETIPTFIRNNVYHRFKRVKRQVNSNTSIIIHFS